MRAPTRSALKRRQDACNLQKDARGILLHIVKKRFSADRRDGAGAAPYLCCPTLRSNPFLSVGLSVGIALTSMYV